MGIGLTETFGFDEATEVKHAVHAVVMTEDMNLLYRSALVLASYEKMGKETATVTALGRRRRGHG